MSNQWGFDIISNTKYNTQHIGGQNSLDKNKAYVTNQMNVLENIKRGLPQNYKSPYESTIYPTNLLYNYFNSNIQNQNGNNKISEDTKYERFDEITQHLYNRGLVDRTNKIRYESNYLLVDSQFRNKVPKITTENLRNLATNPLKFTSSESEVFIKDPGHNYQALDRIVLTGVPYEKVVLKVRGGQSVATSLPDYIPNENMGISFKFESNIMKVWYTHGIYAIFTPPVPQPNVAYADSFFNKELYVEISGFNYVKPNFNIPLNAINRKHRVLLQNPEVIDTIEKGYVSASDTTQAQVFYIQLPEIYTDPDNSGVFFPAEPFNITLTFYYKYGIPIQYLNAEYPIDERHYNGYHVIRRVTPDGYFINLPWKASADTLGETGGNNIFVGKILSIDSGFSSPSSYGIELGKTINNIVMARIISSAFPNTEKVIRDFPEERRNNRFYWQNLNDGGGIYKIDLPAGNYTPDSLLTKIQQLVYQVPKNITENPYGYNDKNYISGEIDTTTDIVTFRSYNEALLNQPIVYVDPPIGPFDGPAIPTNGYRLIFEHNFHKLTLGSEIINNSNIVINPNNRGDTIIISNSISYQGIPAATINGSHEVLIPYEDGISSTSGFAFSDPQKYYAIRLKSFNLLTTKDDTGGGSAVTIYAPNKFRLRFDYDDTFGELLGFRNIGQNVAITQYESIITNNMAYEDETGIDEFGNLRPIRHNAVILSGYNYINMVCNQFSLYRPIQTNTPIKEVFYQILLSCLPAKIAFNTFVDTPKYFYDPIPAIDQLEFEFYTPDGFLFDFNGVDHNFVLELVTYNEFPKGSN